MGTVTKRLLIVARDRQDCYRRLRTAFADDATMVVIFDRRLSSPHSARAEAGAAPGGRERRRHDIRDALLTQGWAMIKVAEEEGGGRRAAGPGEAKILLVEDDVLVLEMLRDILHEAGYRPRATADPREALALLGTERFDLVIADLVMPHVDGLHLLEKAKARSPGTRVLLMSAYGTDQLVRDGLGKGASAFIAKPFEVAPFVATIREFAGASGAG